MKKYLSLIVLVLVAFVVMAQERVVNSSRTTFGTGVSYLNYTAVAADTLKETNQDTIDFIFNNQNHEAIEKIVFNMSLDSLAGNDSIYYVLSGFNDLYTGTNTTIASGGILVNQSNELIQISKWFYTNDTTYVDLSFRGYKLRFIQDGNNDYDGGAKFDYIRAKLYFK